MLYTRTLEANFRGNKVVVFAATNGHEFWYIQTGGEVINVTLNPIISGTNLEEVDDIDCFTWPDGVHREEDLIEAIEFEGKKRRLL